VIKEAKLEFGKITVLIGPQASGKSLLCKLAYFLQVVVVEQAERAIREARDLDTFRLRTVDEFIHVWFPAFGPQAGATATYEDGQYRVTLSRKNSGGMLSSGTASAGMTLSPEIELAYNKTLRELQVERDTTGSVDFNRFAREIKQSLEDLQSQDSAIYSFIPSTRSFFITSQKAIIATSNRTDQLTLRFSQDFSFDYRKRVPKMGLEHELTGWIDSETRRILQGKVEVRGNAEVFCADDGREIPLSFLSSGSQELLPLMTCLREFVALSSAVSKALDLPKALHRRLFFIEEPESNIFPSTQNDLVQIFARMAKEPVLDASWVITTHSPYILTAFNGLIEAWRAGNKPGKREEVAALIPERYWINENDFAAYTIRDGVLVPIFEKETEGKEGSGLIDGDYLDSISDELGSQFEKLLDIEYAE
jgi:hypothetical protein